MLKRIFDLALTLLILFFGWPLMVLIALAIKLTSKGPIIFSQKRAGKLGKVFTIYKFRTMYPGAEKDREKFKKLNEASGPVFKIKNDPRFVGIGKFLARTALDELPQLFNVIKGEMSLVGPRPLPVYEAKQLKPWQKKREKVLPGITSAWVVNGRHNLSFTEWINSDLEYIKKAKIGYDSKILLKTFWMMAKLVIAGIFNDKKS